jgi:DNA-binding response OmpR family regulator
VAEEIRFDFADGRTISTLVDAAPIYSPDGKISGAIAIIQDITPLEEVERLRSEFLGLVSHELKTPLTAIKGAAAAVLGASRAPDAGEALELFQIINEQADRLRELVDNLLDVTRIEAGSLSVNPEPVELGPILDEARQTLCRAGYGQEVRFELADGLPALNADRRRLVQVLVNLLTNAAKSSPEQAPITVSAEARETDVIVRVKDLGRGIAKDQLSRLFEKFARLHGERDAGTGLGLTIARGIVRAHGGRIWADSAGEGKGAAFSFTLPLAPQPATAAAASSPSPGIVRTGDRRRILVVDDDPRVVRLLRRALDEAGYEVMEPKGWDDIASSVELEQPDLIVLDLMLPGASGFDVLQRVRELSSVPVIFLTASDDNADIVRALRLGADDYITKPFFPLEVIARAEAILRREGTHKGSLRPPFALGGLNVNFAERRVTVDGKPVKLTATEYKLLHELAANAGQVLTHDQILDRVWGAQFIGASDLVRAFVRNLRRKLGDDARRPRYVVTERQVGYRMPRPS